MDESINHNLGNKSIPPPLAIQHKLLNGKFTVEVVKQLFPCLKGDIDKNNEENICERCCHFLNHSSDQLTLLVYHISEDNDPSKQSEQISHEIYKRRKISKDIIQNGTTDRDSESAEISIPSTSTGFDLNDKPDKITSQFELIMQVLSQDLLILEEEINKLDHTESADNLTSKVVVESQQSNTAPLNVLTITNSSIFAHFSAVQRDLVKTKRFLTFKSSRSNSQNGVIKSNQPGSIDVYNQYISMLLKNRLLLLQLLHFECSILRYFELIERKLQTQMVAILSHNLVQTKLQSLFRNYYSLLIKLTYEVPYLQVISLIHRKSPHVTSVLSLILFRLIASKVTDFETQACSVLMDELVPPVSNNRTLIMILDYIYIMARLDLYPSQGEFLKVNFIKKHSDCKVDFVKMEKSLNEFLDFKQLIPSEISLVTVCRLMISGFVLQPEFQPKSLVRYRIIEILSFISRQSQWDAFGSTSLLIPSILNLLSRCVQYHSEEICKGSLLDLSHTAGTINKCNVKKKKSQSNESDLKAYLCLLRDIYGLLSILLTFTEHTFSLDYLRFLGVHEVLLNRFMVPFVYSVNGTELADPEFITTDLNKIQIKNRSKAYLQLRYYFKQYSRVVQYMDRIVVMSSIFIQRLLPPLVLPIQSCRNPFSFELPTEIPADNQDDNNQSEGLDDGQFLSPFGSDVEDFNMDEDSEEDDLINSSQSSNNDQCVTPEKKNTTVQEETNDFNLKTYLKFFPEIKHFNFDSLQSENSKQIVSTSMENILCCLCDGNIKHLLSEKDSNYCDPNVFNPDLGNNKNFDYSFSWSQTYEKESKCTNSVMPKISLPTPESKFTNDDSYPDEDTNFMTYPFLDQTLKRKNYHHIKILDHIKSRITNNNKQYKVVYDIENPNLDSGEYLRFDSQFESGNLRKALVSEDIEKRSDNEEEYILLLNTDVNASTHTQWFYFSVQGMKCDKRYRFQLINCEKKSILYNSGQQPLFYSSRDFVTSGKTWQRIGMNDCERNVVAYYRNHFVRNSSRNSFFKEKPFFTLEFTFSFPYPDDVCYFAYNIPFSYSFLKTHLTYWSDLTQKHNSHAEPNDQIYFSVQTLCSSLNGNKVPVVTITSNCHHNPPVPSKPHYIFITARVHPAESNSSWILKGFIDFLLHASNVSVQEQLRHKLLQKYIFKIIPMLNPDGVINGCTRTDLQTNDLNRHWDEPSPLLHPTIYHSKMLLKCLHHFSSGNNPIAYLDLHGHSRRHNIFSYSCAPQQSWKKSDRHQYIKQSCLDHVCVCSHKNVACQLKDHIKVLNSSSNVNSTTNGYYIMPPYITLPALFRLQHTPAFEIDNCSFLVQRDREQTARVVCWRQFGIPLSYTIECSAAGCDSGPYSGQHLSIYTLKEMGKHIASSFAYLEFLYCSSRHFPVIVFPKNSLHRDGDSDFVESLLAKCIKRNKSNRTQTPRQKKQKQKLIQMYPDLKIFASNVLHSSANS